VRIFSRAAFRLPPPDDSEVSRITASMVKKIHRLLERRGLGQQAYPEEADPLLREQPLLAELYSALVQARIVIGPGVGERIKGVKFQFEREKENEKVGRSCANLSGFSLHANVCIPAQARWRIFAGMCSTSCSGQGTLVKIS
jgi:hypothetical protein